MRIVSYNILDGGEGRADPLAEVLLAQKADIVALVEAEDDAVLERIAGRLEMDFVAGHNGPHASALLSRWPIRETVNHAPLHMEISKSLLEATVAGPGGEDWTIGVVHLHAHATVADEERRLKELEVVLAAFARHRDAARGHILCGDFNSNSPVQQIDPQRCKPSTREEWQQNGGMLPRQVVQRLLDAGYVDSLHAIDPRAGESAGTFSTQFPGQRVDYLFAWGVDRRLLKGGWIEQDRLAKYASDHFPVGLDIDPT